MKKVVYREPAFLRDIHRSQIANYNRRRSMDISERINWLIEKADEQVKRIGYDIVDERKIKMVNKN